MIFKQSNLYLIEVPLCNSAKCKMKFAGHWLRYSIKANVSTLSTQSLQALNLALIHAKVIQQFLLHYHYQVFAYVVFTPIYKNCPL